MPYIDVTVANEELRKVRQNLHPQSDNYAMGFCEAIKQLNMLSTADVVPKSEVENIFEEIGKILYRYDKQSERDGSEYGELIVGDIAMGIAELKKKYEEVK